VLRRWVDQLLLERPWVAYALFVAMCVVVTVSAVAIPPEKVTPNHTLDVAIGVLVVWSGVASLFLHRFGKPTPLQAFWIRAGLAFSAETFGLAVRFITGSAVLAWLGFGIAAAALAAAVADLR